LLLTGYRTTVLLLCSGFHADALNAVYVGCAGNVDLRYVILGLYEYANRKPKYLSVLFAVLQCGLLKIIYDSFTLYDSFTSMMVVFELASQK